MIWGLANTTVEEGARQLILQLRVALAPDSMLCEGGPKTTVGPNKHGSKTPDDLLTWSRTIGTSSAADTVVRAWACASLAAVADAANSTKTTKNCRIDDSFESRRALTIVRASSDVA